MSEEFYDPNTGDILDSQSIVDALVGSIIEATTGMYAPKPVDDKAVMCAMMRALAFGLAETYKTDALAMQKLNEMMPRMIAEERAGAADLPVTDDDGNIPTLN